jgi:putative glutamine amidotransferase
MSTRRPNAGRPIRLGVSACLSHPDDTRQIFKGKTLLYAEESMLQWIMRHGALPMLIPRAYDGFSIGELVEQVDGLLLEGGADVSPLSYGEAPLKPEWAGDCERDQYEITLIEACLRRDKPILGVCRGIQMLNVALGGTLYQDIQTALPDALVHRDWEQYDQLFHEVRIDSGSYLHRLFDTTGGTINSVHHQSVKALGRDLVVEAISPEDGIIEAVRLAGDNYAVAIQWHPEFQDPANGTLLDPSPVLNDFLREIDRRLAR